MIDWLTHFDPPDWWGEPGADFVICMALWVFLICALARSCLTN